VDVQIQYEVFHMFMTLEQLQYIRSVPILKFIFIVVIVAGVFWFAYNLGYNQSAWEVQQYKDISERCIAAMGSMLGK
jgi:hypothetical protein